MKDPYLVINNAKGERQLPMGDEPVTIGRSSGNRLVVSDGLTSRHHCVIERVPEGFQVRDLGSRNGTRLNGEPVKTALLLDGDEVQVGKTRLKLVVPEETEEEKRAEKIESAQAEGDYEKVLRLRAEALPDKAFEAAEIALVNARGQMSHPAAGRKQGGDAIDVLRLVLLICFRSRATDIHLEQKADDFTIRVRVDGTMVDVVRLKKEIGQKLLAVVKILSDIDIAQKNIVQEGSFSARVEGRRVDYRVSFAPAVYGQKLVVRVLDTANAPLYVWDLQMPEWMSEDIQKAIQREAGMVLVCGPTGSGKTTTLYAAVRSIDSGERNVVTIEDPVEIQIEGVTQIPVHAEQGNTFPNLLRSVLRQDPDAILVGEIRDSETARIAMQAAMTGHLVFSTVHARDTIGTIFRLLDLGIEPYLIASGLHLVLAQRLVRQLCPYCRTPVKPTEDQLARMGTNGQTVETIYEPAGCPRCLGTGYAGRRALFELLTTTDKFRDVILRSPTLPEIQEALAGTRFVKLGQTGYELVAEGITSFDEIDRAVGSDAPMSPV